MVISNNWKLLYDIKWSVILQCAEPYVTDDVIILNGDDKDFELMKVRMEARRAAAKLAKKGKKRAKADSSEEPAVKISKKGTESVPNKPKRKGAEITNGTLAKTVKPKQVLSVQNDPTSSETYKSLFTSCDEAKKQSAQHSGWVSFNPQYFR